MNEQTVIFALALPEPATLAGLLKKQDGLDAMLSQLEIAARNEAKGHDIAQRKGRDALKSIAYKVSTSKTELDKQGLALTESARKEIDAINAGRKLAKDRLDALRDEIKKPAVDWEEAEETRKTALKDRLCALDAGRADANCSTDQIAAVLADMEAVETGADWAEYQAEAEIAKAKAVAALRNNLSIAEKREADARELEELRAMKAAKDAEECQRREAEEAAAVLKIRADNARAYIKAAGEGMIGGKSQAFGILIYELETKLPPLIDDLGDHAEGLHDLRMVTLRDLTERMKSDTAKMEAEAEAQRKDEAARLAQETANRAAREKEESEARHQAEIAEQKRLAEQRIEDERARLAQIAKAEADARAEREADQQHRATIRNDIIEALAAMRGKASPEEIADALMAGEIPHTEVKL